MNLNISEPPEPACFLMRGDKADRTDAAIGNRLKETRLAMGITQRELCRRSGIQPNTYNQWEKGRGRPSLDEAIKLADGLDISLDWIYFGDPAYLPYALGAAIMRPRQNPS